VRLTASACVLAGAAMTQRLDRGHACAGITRAARIDAQASSLLILDEDAHDLRGPGRVTREEIWTRYSGFLKGDRGRDSGRGLRIFAGSGGPHCWRDKIWKTGLGELAGPWAPPPFGNAPSAGGDCLARLEGKVLTKECF